MPRMYPATVARSAPHRAAGGPVTCAAGVSRLHRPDRQPRSVERATLPARRPPPGRGRKPVTLCKLHPGTVSMEHDAREVEVGTDFVVPLHPILMIFFYIR
jgi:hypothetical protein